MIDYEKLELLLQKDPIAITRGARIDQDFWRWFFEKKPTVVSLISLFEGGTFEDPVSYPTDIACFDCSTIFVRPLSKTALGNYMRALVSTNKKVHFTPMKCEACEKKEGESDVLREHRRKLEQEHEAKKILELLTSDIELTKEERSDPDGYLALFSRHYTDEFSHRLFGNMPYRNFLQTKYWRMVSLSVKRSFHNRCALCCSQERLATHHRAYRWRGVDHSWKGRKNLICLCEKCHTKHHKVDDPICRD